MDRVLFRIISPDEVIAFRWQKAFHKEGWRTAVSEGCPENASCPGGQAELLLVEICPAGIRTPDDLSRVRGRCRPVSLMVFGEQGRTPNGQISSLLEAGADDFIYKNLDERVLVAKLKAHVRRLMPTIEEAASKVASTRGDIQIDRSRRAVRIEVRSGKYAELENLTQKEFDILAMLVKNEERVLSRENMLEHLWGDGAEEVYSECIDKHIESLRRKLGMYGKRIKTVYGSGYMFLGNPRT